MCAPAFEQPAWRGWWSFRVLGSLLMHRAACLATPSLEASRTSLLSRACVQVRVLMRRDHTFKVCANHIVTPDLKVEPMMGSNKALTYYTADHSGINNVGEYTGEGLNL